MEKTLSVLGLCLLSVAAIAADNIFEGPLEGTYRITPEAMVDPGPDDMPDRVGIYIRGDAAEKIYEKMPVPETRKVSLCDPDFPYLEKQAGNFVCRVSEGRVSYDCSVVIKLDTGEVVTGYEGC